MVKFDFESMEDLSIGYFSLFITLQIGDKGEGLLNIETLTPLLMFVPL